MKLNFKGSLKKKNHSVQEALEINGSNFCYLTSEVSTSFIAMFFLMCHNYTSTVLQERSQLVCYSAVLGC